MPCLATPSHTKPRPAIPRRALPRQTLPSFSVIPKRSKMRIVLAAMLLLASFGANAQVPIQTPTNTVPPAIRGFGTLSVTTASVLLSTLTLGPNSSTWPSAPRQLFIVNSPSSADIAYVCPLGGVCTSANGIPIGVGSSYGFFEPVTAMTICSATTSTILAQW